MSVSEKQQSSRGHQSSVLRKKKIQGRHKVCLKTLKNQAVWLLRGYSAELEEELMTAKSCLEEKVVMMSKLDMEILDSLDDEVKIATDIKTSGNIQSEIHLEMLREENLQGPPKQI